MMPVHLLPAFNGIVRNASLRWKAPWRARLQPSGERDAQPGWGQPVVSRKNTWSSGGKHAQVTSVIDTCVKAHGSTVPRRANDALHSELLET